MCSILQCTAHIQPSKFISNIILKSVHHFGTPAGVIRVFIYRRFWRSHLRKSLKIPPPPPSQWGWDQPISQRGKKPNRCISLFSYYWISKVLRNGLTAGVCFSLRSTLHIQYTSFYERSTLSLLIGRSGWNKTKFLTPIQCLSPALKGLPLESC